MYQVSKNLIILSSKEYVDTLTKGSHKKVEVKCPRCGCVHCVYYKNLVKSGSSFCHNCAMRKTLDQHIGKKFGHWTVIGFGNDRKTVRQAVSTFLCICDCGEQREVTASDVIRGKSLSCGCIGLEKCSGENSNFYKPELTDQQRETNTKQRKYAEYKRVVKLVRKRDNCTCHFCGKFGDIVHHLYDYAHHPELRTDPDNLVCCCKKCHKLFHQYTGGYPAKTTKRDNFNFLTIIQKWPIDFWARVPEYGY